MEQKKELSKNVLSFEKYENNSSSQVSGISRFNGFGGFSRFNGFSGSSQKPPIVYIYIYIYAAFLVALPVWQGLLLLIQGFQRVGTAFWSGLSSITLLFS